MEFPRLVYRVGSAWQLDSGRYDLLTVASPDELAAAQAEGWRLDQYTAKDAHEGAESAPVDAPAAPRARKARG